jgi:hypothetical protein
MHAGAGLHHHLIELVRRHALVDVLRWYKLEFANKIMQQKGGANTPATVL